jgi:hypothetical protein
VEIDGERLTRALTAAGGGPLARETLLPAPALGATAEAKSAISVFDAAQSAWAYPAELAEYANIAQDPAAAFMFIAAELQAYGLTGPQDMHTAFPELPAGWHIPRLTLTSLNKDKPDQPSFTFKGAVTADFTVNKGANMMVAGMYGDMALVVCDDYTREQGNWRLHAAFVPVGELSALLGASGASIDKTPKGSYRLTQPVGGKPAETILAQIDKELAVAIAGQVAGVAFVNTLPDGKANPFPVVPYPQAKELDKEMIGKIAMFQTDAKTGQVQALDKDGKVVALAGYNPKADMKKGDKPWSWQKAEAAPTPPQIDGLTLKQNPQTKVWEYYKAGQAERIGYFTTFKLGARDAEGKLTFNPSGVVTIEDVSYFGQIMDAANTKEAVARGEWKIPLPSVGPDTEVWRFINNEYPIIGIDKTSQDFILANPFIRTTSKLYYPGGQTSDLRMIGVNVPNTDIYISYYCANPERIYVHPNETEFSRGMVLISNPKQTLPTKYSSDGKLIRFRISAGSPQKAIGTSYEKNILRIRGIPISFAPKS